MNIISNSCVGANIMRDRLKCPYNNPFCWCLVDFNSMYNLITNWDTINFDKIELIPLPGKDICAILIDGKVLIRYVHYHRSVKDLKIRKSDVEIYYCKIEDYVLSSYKRRLARMRSENKPPIFVIGSSWWTGEFTQEEIEKFLQIDTKYQIVIIGKERDTKRKNVLFVECKVKNNNGPIAKDVYDKLMEVNHGNN